MEQLTSPLTNVEFLAGMSPYGDLQKALTAAGQTGTDASAMIPEDLEMEAYSTLWKKEHLRLLRMLPTVPAYAQVHEYSRITGYTGQDTEGFFPEGGTPSKFDFTSQRQVEQIRPLGEGFSITGVAGKVRTIRGLGQMDLIGIQRATKLLGLMQKITRASYFANTAGFGAGATVKFRGIEQILDEDADSRNVIDLEGQSATQDTFDIAAQYIFEAYGLMTHVNMNPQATKNFVQTIPNVRNVIGIGEDLKRGAVGSPVRTLRTQYGDAELLSDLFLSQKHSRYKTPPLYNGTTNPKPTNAPATPTINTQPAATGTAAPKFNAREIADFGTYRYAITADNSHSVSVDAAGESDPVFSNDVTVAATEQVDIIITGQASISTFRLYRHAGGGDDTHANYQFIQEKDASAGSNVTFTDVNDVISHTKDTGGTKQNTSVGFGFTLPTYREATAAGAQMKMQYPVDVEDAVKQVKLAPIFPRPQAILGDLIINELLLAYCCIEIPTPNRVVKFKNLGNRNL
jgi:hypothetical protein